MKAIDLTHTINAGMTVYPGADPPRVETAGTIADHGFAERRLTLLSHTGTHVDAPAHLLADGRTLDEYDVADFIGPAVCLDVSNRGGMEIRPDDLEAVRDRLAGCRFLLLRTGWSRHWGTPRYFEGYPVLSAAAADWLAESGIGGIGLDAISVDPVGAADLSVHRILLARGLLIVENLTRLERLPDGGFLFSCLPLKLAEADGSPVRAVGFTGRDPLRRRPEGRSKPLRTNVKGDPDGL